MVLIDEFTLQETSAPSYSQISSTLRTSCVGIEELKSVPSKKSAKISAFRTCSACNVKLHPPPPPPTLFEDGFVKSRVSKLIMRIFDNSNAQSKGGGG